MWTTFEGNHIQKKRRMWLWNQDFFFLGRNNLTTKSWRQGFFLYFVLILYLLIFFSNAPIFIFYFCGNRQKIEDKRKLMRNSCFLPPGAVVLIGDFCSRLSNEVFDELERMTKALQLLYWLHVCSRCHFPNLVDSF